MATRENPYGETERAKQWSDTIIRNFEAQSGVGMTEWVERLRTCPHPIDQPRKMLAWLKEQYGLGQNHGMTIMATAYPEQFGWDAENAETLVDALFSKKHEAVRPLYDALLAQVLADGAFGPESPASLTVSARKTYVSLSRSKQFAVLLPKAGALVVGLALPAQLLATTELPTRLLPIKNLGGGDRIQHHFALQTITDLDAEVWHWLRAAYDAA